MSWPTCLPGPANPPGPQQTLQPQNQPLQPQQTPPAPANLPQPQQTLPRTPSRPRTPAALPILSLCQRSPVFPNSALASGPHLPMSRVLRDLSPLPCTRGTGTIAGTPWRARPELNNSVQDHTGRGQAGLTHLCRSGGKTKMQDPLCKGQEFQDGPKCLTQLPRVLKGRPCLAHSVRPARVMS